MIYGSDICRYSMLDVLEKNITRKDDDETIRF